MKVKQAMHSGVDWCSPRTSLVEVARLMRDDDVGAIPIGENDRLTGMVTDRDIVIRAIAEGVDVSKLHADDVMSRGIIYCTADEDIEDAIHRMEEKHVRRLPVIDGNKRMVGMLSLGDFSHAIGHELTGEWAEAISAHH